MNRCCLPDSEIAAWVGFDWADQQHVISLRAAGSAAVERSTLDQQPEALQAWVGQLQARFPTGKVVIALEQSRGAVIYALMGYDFLVLYPIPPKSLARYREAFAGSGAKADPSDAELLRELVERHREKFHAWLPDDPDTRQLLLLCEHRRKLVDHKTQLTNQLQSLLKSYFPQALEWVGELDSRQACDFLEQWPSLQAMASAGPEQLRQFYRRHHCSRPVVIQRRLEQLQQAQPLTRDRAVIEAHSQMVRALVAQLRPLLESLSGFDHQIQSLLTQHPDHAVFLSFPGVGPTFGSRLLTAWGTDRDRFSQAREMQQLSGIAPITQQSGKTRRVQRRWARPRFLHQTFYEYAGQSLLSSIWARAFYNHQRARGKGHPAALRALSYKWIRIFFRCWQDRVPYNEQVYLAAVQRRQPSWLSQLPAAQQKLNKKKVA